MDDLDDNFDDDDFDLIGILEKAELDYSNTQQQRSKHYNSSDNNNVPDNGGTNANTTFFGHNGQQQQHYMNMDHDSSMPESFARSRSNWNPTLQPSHGFGPTENRAGPSSGSVTEYTQYERKQDMELETALRDGARLRSELTFKNQELKNLKLELRDIKKKALLQQQQQQQQDEINDDRDMMKIDQPSPSLTNSQSNTQTTSDLSQKMATSRRNSPFPTRLGFTGHRVLKRPRISSSPSPAQPHVSLLHPPPQQQTEVETKQQRELKQVAFQQAVNAKVADQLGIVRHDIEQQRQMQKQHDVQAFSQCLSLVKFVKDHLHRSSMAPLQEPLELHTIVAEGLRPARVLTDTDRTLNVLANDISACISQIYTLGVKATLSHIFFVLRGLIQICIQDQKHITFVRAVDLIYTLSIHYSPYIITHLQQEISGAGDQSILHLLTKGLQLIPLSNTNEGPSKHSFICGLPETAIMTYSHGKEFLQDYPFSASDIRELLAGVTSVETQETTSMVLNLLSGVCNTVSEPLSNRFLFLLDQKGFIDLISAQKPLAIVSEALYLIHSLVVNESKEWVYNKKYRLLLETISSFAELPRPSGPMEVPWYHLKLAVLQIFDRILAIDPVPLSPKETLTWALYPSIYILNNECMRIQDSSKPPFESVPQLESNTLIVEAVFLMYRSLLVHPVLLDYADTDSVYLHIIASLKRMKLITGASVDMNRRVGPTFAKLTQLINQKDSVMASAPES